MRVSFFGKGGSGKTTMTTAFVKYLQKTKKDCPIFAIDADINVHLGTALQMKTKYLGDDINQISYYLEMNRDKPEVRTSEKGKKYYDFITSTPDLIVMGQTPPSLTTNFITPSLNDPFFKYFATFDEKNKTALITVGSYNDAKLGSACFHSKLGSVELIYNRLLDGKNSFVVTDSTAGVDSVGTSLFFASDINVFVVEPTIKAISVYLDFVNITKNYKLNNYVIINKCTGQEDRDFIEKYIPKDKILGYVENSVALKKFEQGIDDSFDDFVKENGETFENIVKILDKTERDWKQYYVYLLQTYITNAEDWYSQYYNVDLLNYIDPDFDYEKVLKKYKLK